VFLRSGIDSGLNRAHRQQALRFKKEQELKLGRPKGPGKSKLDTFRPEIESLLANGKSSWRSDIVWRQILVNQNDKRNCGF
jgi:hypothetical protein